MTFADDPQGFIQELDFSQQVLECRGQLFTGHERRREANLAPALVDDEFLQDIKHQLGVALRGRGRWNQAPLNEVQ